MSEKRLTVYRKRQFPAALMPYWIITSVSKSDFMEKFNLKDDISCYITRYGHPMIVNMGEYGVKIRNGEKMEWKIHENVKSVFATTIDGLLSNEIVLNPQMTFYEIIVTTKVGWKIPSYPQLTLK